MESLRPKNLFQVAARAALLAPLLLPLEGAETAPHRLEVFSRKFTKEASPEVRSAAVEDLVECDDPEIAKRILTKAFEDPEATVNLTGVRILSKCKDAPSIDWLVANGPKHEKPQVRHLSLLSLSRIADPRVPDLLVAALDDPSWLVASTAARGLAVQKAAKGVPALLKSLEHKDLRVRISAVDALAGLKAAEAAAPLMKLLEADKEWRVKSAVCDALVALQAKDALAPLRRLRQTADGRLKDDLDQAIRALEGGDPNDPLANYGLKYRGIGTSSKRITFVLDCSLSTGAELSFAAKKTPLEPGCENTKLGAAKSELIRTLNEYAKVKGGKFNMIFIHDDYDLWKPALVDASADNIKLALKHVKLQKSAGRTNLGDALAAALLIEDGGATDLKPETLKEVPDTLFIVSDGLSPNEGKYKHPENLLEIVRDINRFARVRIHGIATGGGDFLKQLSEQNHGTYVEKVEF